MVNVRVGDGRREFTRAFALGEQLGPRWSSGQRLRESGRREKDVQLRIAQQKNEVSCADARCHRDGFGRARLPIDESSDDMVQVVVTRGRHIGKTATTAVQLWKPSNCPSARAICPWVLHPTRSAPASWSRTIATSSP